MFFTLIYISSVLLGHLGVWLIGDDYTSDTSQYISTSSPHDYILPSTGWEYYFEKYLPDETLTVVGHD